MNSGAETCSSGVRDDAGEDVGNVVGRCLRWKAGSLFILPNLLPSQFHFKSCESTISLMAVNPFQNHKKTDVEALGFCFKFKVQESFIEASSTSLFRVLRPRKRPSISTSNPASAKPMLIPLSPTRLSAEPSRQPSSSPISQSPWQLNFPSYPPYRQNVPFAIQPSPIPSQLHSKCLKVDVSRTQTPISLSLHQRLISSLRALTRALTKFGLSSWIIYERS